MATSRAEEQRGRWADDRASAPPRAESLLQVWQAGSDASPGERGLLLLRVAAPALSEADCAALSAGQRDARLLELFRQLFGDIAGALVSCPNCCEQLEFDVALAEVNVAPPPDRQDRYTLVHCGHEIVYRLPSAGDLATLGMESCNDTLGVAVRSLAQRCVLAVHDAGGAQSDVGLSGEAADALEAAMAAKVTEADPQALVMLTFDCPLCTAQSRAAFDIVEFLWRRLDVFARTLLRDVHVLASNYGWSEPEILALAECRRRHYIELIGA
jgi:hypothetical protein